MKQLQVQFVKKSNNRKIGSIPCTTSDSSTCPDSCPLKDNGCYYSSGFYTRLNWQKIDSGERGGDWSTMCDSIAALEYGQLWRHNIGGDLPHTDQKIDTDKMLQLARANFRKDGFTYTHHETTGDSETAIHNRAIISELNAQGFTVNLSADTVEQAVELSALDIAPVVCTVSADTVNNFEYKGIKFVCCPATYRDSVKCETCKMCSYADRDIVITFPAHGAGKNKLNWLDA